MPYILPDGRTIAPEMPFELGDIQYPPNYLKYTTEQERAAMGVTWQEPQAEPAPQPFVPSSVTPYQARVAISNAGLREQVEAAVASADQATKDAWEYGISVDRYSPMIASLGAALGLTPEQIDQLFIAASQVQ